MGLDEACLLQKRSSGLVNACGTELSNHRTVEEEGGTEWPSGPMPTAFTVARPPPSIRELVCNVPPITHLLGLTFLTNFNVSLSHSIVCTWSFTLKVSFDPEPCEEGLRLSLLQWRTLRLREGR